MYSTHCCIRACSVEGHYTPSTQYIQYVWCACSPQHLTPQYGSLVLHRAHGPPYHTFYVCTLQTVPPLPSSLLITHSSHLRTLAVSLAIGSTCRQVELRSVVRREETALSSRQSKTAFFFLSTPALHPRERAIPGSNREGEGGREGGWVEDISKRGGGECTEEAVQYK